MLRRAKVELVHLCCQRRTHKKSWHFVLTIDWIKSILHGNLRTECLNIERLYKFIVLRLQLLLLLRSWNWVLSFRLKINTGNAGHASFLNWLQSIRIMNRLFGVWAGFCLISLLLLAAEYFLDEFAVLLLFSDFLHHFVGKTGARDVRLFGVSGTLWSLWVFWVYRFGEWARWGTVIGVLFVTHYDVFFLFTI